jgi:hypothetical protein
MSFADRKDAAEKALHMFKTIADSAPHRRAEIMAILFAMVTAANTPSPPQNRAVVDEEYRG